MFRDPTHAACAIATLLDRSSVPALQRVWSRSGPRAPFDELLLAAPDGDARTLLILASTLWRGGGRAAFAQALRGLSGDHQRHVADFQFAALAGHGAIDEWIMWRGGPLVPLN